jgi:hypothetical protein
LIYKLKYTLFGAFALMSSLNVPPQCPPSLNDKDQDGDDYNKDDEDNEDEEDNKDGCVVV